MSLVEKLRAEAEVEEFKSEVTKDFRLEELGYRIRAIFWDIKMGIENASLNRSSSYHGQFCGVMERLGLLQRTGHNILEFTDKAKSLYEKLKSSGYFEENNI